MKRALHHGLIESAAGFLSHQFSSQGLSSLLSRLRRCKLVQIPLFNGDHTGNGNHWGLFVIHKETATIYVYDSLSDLQAFQSLLPNIKIVAESVSTKFGTECAF